MRMRYVAESDMALRLPIPGKNKPAKPDSGTPSAPVHQRKAASPLTARAQSLVSQLATLAAIPLALSFWFIAGAELSLDLPATDAIPEGLRIGLPILMVALAMLLVLPIGGLIDRLGAQRMLAALLVLAVLAAGMTVLPGPMPARMIGYVVTGAALCGVINATLAAVLLERNRGPLGEQLQLLPALSLPAIGIAAALLPLAVASAPKSVTDDAVLASLAVVAVAVALVIGWTPRTPEQPALARLEPVGPRGGVGVWRHGGLWALALLMAASSGVAAGYFVFTLPFGGTGSWTNNDFNDFGQHKVDIAFACAAGAAVAGLLDVLSRRRTGAHDTWLALSVLGAAGSLCWMAFGAERTLLPVWLLAFCTMAAAVFGFTRLARLSTPQWSGRAIGAMQIAALGGALALALIVAPWTTLGEMSFATPGWLSLAAAAQCVALLAYTAQARGRAALGAFQGWRGAAGLGAAGLLAMIGVAQAPQMLLAPTGRPVAGIAAPREEPKPVIAVVSPAEVDALRTKVAGLETALGTRDGEIRRLTEVIGDQRREITTVRSDIAALRTQLASLAAAVEAQRIAATQAPTVVATPPAPTVALPATPQPANPRPDSEPRPLSSATTAGDCDALQAAPPRVVTLSFGRYQVDLSPDHRAELDRIADHGVPCNGLRFDIAGHTDNRGGSDRNVRIAEQRAVAVTNYLAGRQIERRRMTSRSFAATRPLGSNDTSEGRARNRRVEITLRRGS